MHQWLPLAQNGLLLKAVPNPSSVVLGKGNIELSSSSDNNSSDSGSEESEDSDSGSGSYSSDGSDSSSPTSSSGSHTEKPVKPSFPTGVGTVIVTTAELVDAVSDLLVSVGVTVCVHTKPV